MKYWCNSIDCHVWVFGHSDGDCPSCGILGRKLTEEDSLRITKLYHKKD